MYNYFIASCISTNHENYLENNIEIVKYFHYLSGPSLKINNIVLLKIIEFLRHKVDDVSVVHNPLDPTLIDCISSNNIYIGTYDKKLLKNDKIFYNFFDTNCFNMSDCEISTMHRIKHNKHIENAKLCLSEGKKIHDLWENIYIKNIDFEKLNLIREKYIDIVFKNVIYYKEAKVCFRYFGSVSGYGSINYIPDIINRRKKVYYIKGRPGTCKSSFMKALLEEGRKRGIDAIVYPCASDPTSLDMVEFPELDVCFFDSTPPHEFFPIKDTDEIIDLYEYLLPRGYDEANAKELNEIKQLYNETIALGNYYLSKALYEQNCVENLYLSKVDFFKLSNVIDEIIYTINKEYQSQS